MTPKFSANLLDWQKSDDFKAKYGQSSARSRSSSDDPMCGDDRACKAVVRHAVQVNQKCQEIDCIGIGNDVIGLVATASVAAACLPGFAACASVAVVAGSIGTVSTIGGVGWSIYSWSKDKTTTTDLTVTLLSTGASTLTSELAPGLHDVQVAYSLFQLIYDAAPRE